jgi:hypothetical protein
MRAWMYDQEKERLGGDSRDNRVSAFVFKDRSDKRSTAGRLTNRLCGARDRGGQRGQVFAVEVTARSRVDEESIASQNHHGLDTFALREGPHEVVYGGQGKLRRLFVRSLIGDKMKSSEQSLEVSHVRRLLFAVNFKPLTRLFEHSGGRRLLLLFGAAAALSTAACDDPFAPRATTSTRTDSFVVYSVTQTPINAPAAFNIVFFTTLRLEPTYGFDLVFDIDENGKVVLIPVKLVGGAVTSARQVGLQRITGAYEELTRAPTSGYEYDSTLTLDVGEGALVELRTDVCQFQTSQLVYAKLQIKAIDPATRTIVFRITYDPNCGFRSFLPGVPTN